MLEIKVKTEGTETYTRPTADELTDLVLGIGGGRNRFLVVQRVPDRPGRFVQVWHEGDGPYELEYRAGGPGDHYRTEVSAPERVAEVMAGWARQEEDWDAGIGWESLGLPEAEPVPAPEAGVLARLEEVVRAQLRGGFATVETLIEWAAGCLTEDGVSPVTAEQARAVVERLWLERVEEQESWTGVSDADRLESAFAVLGAAGLTARQNFTCCRSCGMSEVWAEDESARGFVFFHSQGTASAVSGHGLALYYGGFDDSEETTSATGHEVATALRDAGLAVEWDGDPSKAIEVAVPDWRRRLVG
ncbi:hypothetical protein [Streptomyces sp. NBC_00102]|uniref:DUF6891 domain-containing protein n=1 Tax=Streptomyces sp. NBC_00102 TaxID=2975652 RepID=UPI00225BB9A3|nr:hypothetical protein [Streptomyces sp. NBC_00102]MCX5396606.1 hypothetical protein [Streptomyces sp. NBC_00102]